MRSLRSSRPLVPSGLSGASRSAESLESFETTTEKPFSPFTSDINIGAISNIVTAEEGTRTSETKTNVSNIHTGGTYFFVKHGH